MVSTGFVPGDVQVNEVSNTAVASAFREETLTSYEIGSKNRFFDDSLQINGDIWYYRYGGFQQTVTPDLTNPGSTFTAIVPARLKGVELEMLEQITPHDRASLSYSYTDGYYVDEPAGFVTADVLSHISGIAPHTASATYDHIVDLPGGSSLVFHADARYISAHQMGFVSQLQIAEGMAIGAPGQAQAFNQVGGQVIGDLSGLWTSASGKYSVTGYVRNLGNNRYVSVVQMNALGAMPNVTATPCDPRTFGVILAAHF
jgi:iron complex outermembrane receptor protein